MSWGNVEDFVEEGSLIRLSGDAYLVGWGPRSYYENAFKSERPLFYFPDFFLLEEKPWYQHEYAAVVAGHDLLEAFSGLLGEKKVWINSSHDKFREIFRGLKKSIEEGALQKAVPYVFEIAEGGFSREQIKASLSSLLMLAKEKAVYVYGFWNHTEGMLGASPEILFQYSEGKGRLLETMACAGTMPQGFDVAEFLKNPKEAHEHQIVVEGICGGLAKYGKVHIGERQVLQLNRLSHLVTPIHVSMDRKMDFQSVVKALHPTPALGAFPKEVGQSWLKEIDGKIPRGRYGAPVGCVFNEGKDSKCLVGIRNVQWNLQETKLGAGCGVVKESQCENEWKEILLKISSIKDMMSL